MQNIAMKFSTHRLPFLLSIAAAMLLVLICAAAPAAFAQMLQEEQEELTSSDIDEMLKDTAEEHEEIYLSEPKGSERLDRLNARASGAMITEPEQTVLRRILWYVPNRVIDLIDIFKLDFGIGGAAGGVVRASRYGQTGYRYVHPISMRIGLRGREIPFFIERHTEYGIGPEFRQTPNRRITPLELGIGVDAGIGVYAGISIDEFFDFLAGFLWFDPAGDDLVR